MSDNDDNNGVGTTRGADWEVVQLTGSTYNVAAGSNKLDSANETKKSEDAYENEPSAALILSSHFVFPPQDHENLPIEPEASEIHGESESLSSGGGDASASRKDDEFVTGFGNETHYHEVSDERDTVNSMTYAMSKRFQAMYLDEEVEGLLDDSQHSGSYDEPVKGSSETPESPESYAEHSEEKKHDESSLHSDAWWKRHAASAYCRATEGKTLLSIVVAATVVGLVILGHRWQKGKWQFDRHNWRICITDERTSRLLSRYK